MIPTIHDRAVVAGWLRLGASAAPLLVGAMLSRPVLAKPLPFMLPPRRIPTVCLPTGGGFLRARIAGAIDADVRWPNKGTWCAGERKSHPAGVRVSFRGAIRGGHELLFLFGLTGVREGRPLREGRANLTVIDETDGRIFGTLGDRRCTVDSLSQRRLPAAHSYRVDVHGFCTEPARAVHGVGDILVSRFDFAGPVNYADR